MRKCEVENEDVSSQTFVGVDREPVSNNDDLNERKLVRHDLFRPPNSKYNTHKKLKRK